MLQNLGKTVVITGSQIPCFETRSDGRDNIIGALIFAGHYTVPEVVFIPLSYCDCDTKQMNKKMTHILFIPKVTVYFDNKLLRGNRTVKVFWVNHFDCTEKDEMSTGVGGAAPRVRQSQPRPAGQHWH